jgi:hypothetical protein
MSQTDDIQRNLEERLDVDSEPNGPDDAADDVLDGEQGVGIGTDSEPNTFEPEEPSE